MRDKVIQYLLDNQGAFKETFDDLVNKKNNIVVEDKKLFKDEIDLEFKDSLFSNISTDISRATGSDMETIMIVLEEMNLKEYFKC